MFWILLWGRLPTTADILHSPDIPTRTIISCTMFMVIHKTEKCKYLNCPGYASGLVDIGDQLRWRHCVEWSSLVGHGRSRTGLVDPNVLWNSFPAQTSVQFYRQCGSLGFTASTTQVVAGTGFRRLELIELCNCYVCLSVEENFSAGITQFMVKMFVQK